jgi:hypothetical protein
MSSPAEKKKACSAARKTRKRPYDNRPRSGPAPANRHPPGTTEAVRVVLPDEPPRLTPGAAKALLRILIKASDQLDGTDNPEERPRD